MTLPVAYSEPILTSKKELFTKVIHGFQLGSECIYDWKTP